MSSALAGDDAPRRVRYTADWVLPIAQPPIPDGAVLVGADGRIEAVGPAAAVPEPADARAVPLGAAALLPGLVNTHAHPELALFRGYLEDLPFHEWIPRLMAAKRAVPDLDYGAAARLTCAESLAAGVTTLGATEDSAEAFDAFRETGLRGIVYQEVFGPDPRQRDDAVAGLRRKLAALLPRADERVRVGVSPHAPYTVSDALYAAVAELALDEGLPVAAHIAEAEVESLLVTQGEGAFAEGLRRRGIATPPRARSPVALLESAGLLQTRPLLIHCVRLDEADIRAIADSGAAVAHCPTANARLGHGIAPVPELRAAGVPVGLGSDSVASNNRIDLLEEARTAQLVQRARLRRPDPLPSSELLRLATLEGARALGLDGMIGSLEAGKQADLCAVALAAPHVVPVHDPAAAVVHAARGSDVILTVVAGRPLYVRGEWATLDVEALRQRVRAQAGRLPRTAPLPT